MQNKRFYLKELPTNYIYQAQTKLASKCLSLDKMVETADRLNEEKFRDSMIIYLKQLKAKRLLKKVFKLFIKDECSNVFNWGGQKGKKNIQTFPKILNCLIEISKSPEYRAEDFKNEIRICLKEAKRDAHKNNKQVKKPYNFE